MKKKYKTKLHRIASEMDMPNRVVYKDCADWCEVAESTIKGIALGHKRPSIWLVARIIAWSDGGIKFEDLR